MDSTRQDIRRLSIEELRAFFKNAGQKPFRGNQVHQWLWKKGVHTFEEMTNLSLETRKLLADHFVINHIRVDKMQKSYDGTIKNALRLHDDLLVESVLIPTKTRSTACVSSQVGCSLDCTFCATSRLKRMRNLNPDEIYDQVMAIHQASMFHHDRPLSNIVFMGMGEPLMNYKNVLKAIDMITGDQGLGMSPKRITLSTSGVPKMIKKLADDAVKFHLALSLHSAIQEKRQTIMPFAERFRLDDVMKSLIYWYEKTKRRVTFEYIVWKEFNDTDQDILALVNFCKKLPCKVNIIEYNTIDGGEFTQAAPNRVQAYTQALEKASIPVTVRRSRGNDIDAACGQLANKHKKKAPFQAPLKY